MLHFYVEFRYRMCAAVILLLGMMGILSILERKMIFFPTRYPDGEWGVDPHPADRGGIVPWIEECRFKASDGILLHGWHARPHENGKPVESRSVLLWFHGNAGNLTDRYDHLRVFMRIPVQVFIMDYRGYGKSGGSPSEKGIYRDADAAWNFLLQGKGFGADQIVVFGESMGGAVAVDLASRVKPAALILQSTFTSVPDMAARHYPFIPRFLVRTRMDSLSKIPRVTCPVLVIHGSDDEVVPYAFGRKLYDAAPSPRQFMDVPGAMHNDVYLVGGEAYASRLRTFLAVLK